MPRFEPFVIPNQDQTTGEASRERIAQDVAAFRAAGGRVKRLEYLTPSTRIDTRRRARNGGVAVVLGKRGRG